MCERVLEDYSEFEQVCPECGSEEIQEIDQTYGDHEEYLTDPDEADRVLVRRYLCWKCDATFKTGELDGDERVFD